MTKININKTGIVFGSVLAIYHAMWALIVFGDRAKAILDFILKIHFLHFEYNVEPFVFSHALLLVFITGLIGYIFGCIVAYLWNYLHQSSHKK